MPLLAFLSIGPLEVLIILAVLIGLGLLVHKLVTAASAQPRDGYDDAG